MVSDPSQVAAHSFYPFIEFTLTSYKVWRDEADGKLKRIPKHRPIAYASHVDCHIYAYYSFLLSKAYEREIKRQGLGCCILAFRPLGKSNVDFAFEAFETIRKTGECAVVALDITGFFDNLDHHTLKKAWASLIGELQLPSDHFAVYKSLTRFATVNRESLYELLGVSLHNRKSAPFRLCSTDIFRSKVRGSKLITRHPKDKGIPQGSPISALLSNIYMIEFDRVINSFISKAGGYYFRYCDDILLIVPPAHKADIEALAMSKISELFLEINPKKTERVDFTVSDGALKTSKTLQYLGFLYDGQRILLRSASLARYTERCDSLNRQ